MDVDGAGDVDRFLSAMVDSGFNGCVLIAKDERVILHKAYGWVDAAHTGPVSTVTPFWIASISKQFAAVAVLKLVDQGRVSLEDPITRFFEDVPADKSAITVHQLLTHTAGLEQRYAADGIAGRDAAMRAILEQPLAGQPGEGFGYSNDAYNLIAGIVEIASGKPYEVYLRTQILDPAGLMHTGFWGPAEHPEVADILGGAPDSTVARPNWGFRGATGMYSTAADFYRWYRALDESRVLSDSSRRLLFAPHVDRETIDVAYGWFVSPTSWNTTSVWTRGYEGFGHGAVLATYPQVRVVIVVTSNSGERKPRVPVSHYLAESIAMLMFAPR